MKEKFDYNQRIWGTEDARLSPTNWAALKLKYCLEALEGIRGKVLDVGCGGGVFTRGIRHYRRDLELWGVDISKKSIKYAQATSKDVTFLYGDAYQLPFKNQTFDAVVCFDLLEHLEDPPKALRGIKRVLKPGGVFHSATPLEGSLFTVHGWLWKLFRFNPKEQIGHVQHFTLEQLLSLLRQEGFKPIKYKFTRHLFIELVDIVYRFLLRSSGIAERDPSFSVERRLKESKPSSSRRLVTALYQAVILLNYLESRFLARVPGHTVHITAARRD